MKKSFIIVFNTCLSLLIFSRSTMLSQDNALILNDTYQYKVCAIDKDVHYTASVLPTVTTQPVTDIYWNGGKCHGNITSLGVPNPTQHGFCWGPPNPTILNNKIELGQVTSTGEFSAEIWELNSITTYCVRAYATNDAGTSYGEEVYFTTSPHSPSSLTLTCSDITDNSARVVVTMNMGDCYDCCNPVFPPSYWVSWTADGQLHTLEGGPFLITGLDANTYYVVYGHVDCYWDETYDLGAVGFTTLAALPVELISFTAKLENDNVELNWKTATEANNYGFEIEGSQNDDWGKIGFVQGHGNSNSPKEYSFHDRPIGCSAIKYRLKQIDFDGQFEYSLEVEVKLEVPTSFSVRQNFPNPFNPTTKIDFSIPSDDNVQIKVFNVLGMEIATLLNEHRQAGMHSIEFNANNFSSGIYFYKVVSGNYYEIKKMILLR